MSTANQTKALHGKLTDHPFNIAINQHQDGRYNDGPLERSGDFMGICSIGHSSKTHLELTSGEISFVHNNFAQSMTASLLCSAQNYQNDCVAK